MAECMSSRKLDATTKPLRVIGAFFCFTFGGARPPASRFGYLAFCFPVQQTASLSGVGPVFGLSLFLKNRPRRQIFPLEDIGTLFAYLHNRK
jgi:hypothetical protein